MKKNIFIYSTFVLVLIAMAFSFSACSKDDKDSTYLEAFGPSPALRGGELRFLGKGLNNVSEIILPGDISITSIERISNEEIKIILPQNAVSGYITLKASDGDIKTKTLLTFSEPISITKFYKEGAETVTSVKAGDRLVFKGDYLNLIQEVVFTDNVIVSLDRKEGETYSRDSLSVIVPLGARTGKVALSNGASIPILVYTESDLTVVNASVKSISPTTVKPGEELTIKGENLQLVQTIKFSPNLEVEIPAAEKPFLDVTELKVKVPVTAQDGKVILVAHSALEIEAGTIALTAPTITTLSPATVKGGKTLTIKGTNLDLVTDVKFPNIEEAIAPKSKIATELVIEVPLAAGDGKIGLNTASGKVVEKAFTTVKSTITSIAPTSLTAGETITVKGTDLDLVESVLFGGNVSKEVTNPTATAFSVAVPVTATSGKITLKLVSGASVTSTESLTITAANRPIVTAITKSVKPGELLTITGTKLNLVESITFQNGLKATQYGTRNQTTIEVYVPEKAKTGSVTITLKTYEGEEIISPSFTIAGGVEPVEDPSLMIFSFDEGDWLKDALWNGIGGVGTPSDALNGNYYEIKASNWSNGYWWFGNNWLTFPSVSVSDHVLKMDIRLRKDIPADGSEVRLRFANNKEVNILPYLLQSNTWTTGGDWLTITIPLSSVSGLASPTPTNGDWGIVAGWLPTADSNFTGFCVDNIRYQKK